MRFLPALLLIAAPLFAQEPSDEERRVSEELERTARESVRVLTEKRAEEIRRVKEMRAKIQAIEAELRTIDEELGQKTQATPEEAMAAIKRARDRIEDLLPLHALPVEMRVDGTIPGSVRFTGSLEAQTLRFDTKGAAEVISGSADGTDYTLKSLGEGKYELHATKRAEDGKLMEETKDQGTIKEIQEKYPFLRAGLAIQWPNPQGARGGAIAFDRRGRVVNSEGEAVLVKSWGGGGKVGVIVMPPSEDLCFHLELPEGAGFIVQDVVAGSRAEQIGIRRMDILLRLDGELIDSPIQLKKLHEKTGVLEIIRRSETKKIDLATIKEEERPAQIVVEPVPVEPAPEGPR